MLKAMSQRWGWKPAAAAVLLFVLLVSASLYVFQLPRTDPLDSRTNTVDRQWLRKQERRDNLEAERAAEQDRWPATPPPAADPR